MALKRNHIERVPLQFLFVSKEDREDGPDAKLGKLELEPIETCFLDRADCRLLWTKVIEKAIEDYIFLSSTEKSLTEEQQFTLWTATEFLFNDEYTVDFGGLDWTLQELVDSLSSDDLPVEKLRQQVNFRLDSYKIKEKKLLCPDENK